MATYSPILTNTGAAKIAAARVSGTEITYTHLAVGDANGVSYAPASSQTALVHEVWRGEVESVYVHANFPNQVVCEARIPIADGGFDIREAGVFLADGTMLAVSRYPTTTKPLPGSGSEKDLLIRFIFEVANAAEVTHIIDPSLIYATKEYVDARLHHVRLATTANITLSGTQTIDGVTAVVGDRVLVQAQTDGKTNGIYVVKSGAWTRALDFNTPENIIPMALICVSEGTTYKDNIFKLTNDSILLGTTSLVFSPLTYPFETSAANIKMDGTQSTGTRDTAARGDHVHPSDNTKVSTWYVGANSGSARWMKVCTIPTGFGQGSRISIALTGGGSGYGSGVTGHAMLDLTLNNTSVWDAAVYITSVLAGIESIRKVVTVPTTGSGCEVWVLVWTYSNITAIVMGNNADSIVRNSNEYSATDPVGTVGKAFAMIKSDENGNVGVNTNAKSLSSGYNVIELRNTAVMSGTSGNDSYFLTNAYYDGAWKYKTAGKPAARYENVLGNHAFYTAPAAGAADAVITWTKVLEIDSAGLIKAGTSTVWHSANDGSGSGLDADLFDGIDSARFVYGANARATTFAVDANAIVKSGLYHLDSVASNIPVVLGGTLVHTQHYNVDNYASQIYHVYSTTDIYKRTCNNGTWSQWEKIAVTASPAFTGTPTAPTAATDTNTNQIATTAFVKAVVAALVNSSPAALDTLNELAVALGNDPNFATTMTNALANKQPLDATLTALAALATSADKLIYATGSDTFSTTTLTSFIRTLLDDTTAASARSTLGAAPVDSPAFTGMPTAPTPPTGTNTTQIATTAFACGTFAKSTNGYHVLPSGKIEQWGRAIGLSIAPNGTYTITFPTAFLTEIGFVGVQLLGASPDDGVLSVQVSDASSLSQFTITNKDGNSSITQIRWFAVGW